MLKHIFCKIILAGDMMKVLVGNFLLRDKMVRDVQ